MSLFNFGFFLAASQRIKTEKGKKSLAERHQESEPREISIENDNLFKWRNSVLNEKIEHCYRLCTFDFLFIKCFSGKKIFPKTTWLVSGFLCHTLTHDIAVFSKKSTRAKTWRKK